MLNILRKFTQGVGRVVGKVAPVVKRIGQIGVSAGKWALNNHAPLSLAAAGLAEASGNDTFKNIAGLGLMGSAALTSAGIGKRFPSQPRPA